MSLHDWEQKGRDLESDPSDDFIKMPSLLAENFLTSQKNSPNFSRNLTIHEALMKGFNDVVR